MLLTSAEFLEQIDAFLEEAGMGDGTFGRLCFNNTKFVSRLRHGVATGRGGAKVEKINLALLFMTNWRAAERERRREEREARKVMAARLIKWRQQQRKKAG